MSRDSGEAYPEESGSEEPLLQEVESGEFDISSGFEDERLQSEAEGEDELTLGNEIRPILKGQGEFIPGLSDIEEEQDDLEEDFDGFPEIEYYPGSTLTGLDDETQGESAFMQEYQQQFGDPVNTPPRVPVSVENLERMIQLLEEPEEAEKVDYNQFPCYPFPDPAIEDSTPPPTSNRDEDNIMEPSEDEEEKLLILGPDHPKMKRFQNALKRHLKRQLELDKIEQKDLIAELKTRRKDREELGDELFNLEYELNRLTESTEKYDKELQKFNEDRHRMEAEAEEMRPTHENLRADLEQEIKKEAALQKSVKEMDLTFWCVREALRDFEHQQKISANMDQKFQKLKTQLELDKKDQDVYLERLMIRIQQLEQANGALKRQIEAHTEEQKELNKFITEATTEIEALQIEKVHLQRAWNETLSVVRSRDEALSGARKTLADSTEELNLKNAEIKHLTKLIETEQENHERATVLYKKREMEERHLKSRLSTIQDKVEALKANLAILSNMETEMNKNIDFHSKEITGLEKQLEVPRATIQKLLNEKKALEDEILATMQEQLVMDNMSSGITRQIREARDRNQNVEIELSKVENDLTFSSYEVEVLRTDLVKKKTALAEMETKLRIQESNLQTQVLQLKYADKVLQKKNAEVQLLSNKLVKLTQEKDSLGISKLEDEVKDLEKEVQDYRNECIDIQEKWLKLQDELVSLTNKRDQIVNENDLRRKEEYIMQQKHQRLKAEIEKKEEEIGSIQRSIKQAQMEINVLNSRMYEGKEEQENVEKENILIENELMSVLREAELEAIELQDEIRKLEIENEGLHQEFSQCQEQCLIWEKKVKVTKELKENIKKEQKSSITQLKLAIHHMQVRHNELRRIQEKLMTDMEKSIDKRERIIEEASLQVKRNGIHPGEMGVNVAREQYHIYESYRKLLKEAEEADEKVKSTEASLEELRNNVKAQKELLQKIQKVTETADERLVDAAITKHKNLIEIVIRQTKYKTLEAVNLKRLEIPSDPNRVEEQIRKLEEKCYSVVELCDALLEEFPQHKLQFKLIKATILPNVE